MQHTSGDNIDEDEYYEAMSIAQLDELAVNGDDVACAHYVSKRIDEDTMTAADVSRLEASIGNLCPQAAALGAMLFGMKGCLYEDHEKELFCYAILEQYCNPAGHKKVAKAYKKNSKLIDGFDKTILIAALTKFTTDIAARGDIDGLIISLDSAVKGDVIDYKNANLLNITAVARGKKTDRKTVYLSFARDKYINRTITRVIDGAAEFFKDTAEKLKLKSFETYIYGKLDYRYGSEIEAAASRDKISEIDRDNINIKVSENRLTSDRCSECGGAIVDGVCTVCGKHAVRSDDGGIVIQRAKEIERLACTQCGSPVEIEKNGKTAYCPSCGTTFIVNGHALDSGVAGLNYTSIRADMPSDATLPDVKFIRARVMEERLSAIMPESFIIMPEEMKRIKYPTNPPDYIYTTPDSTVNLCLSARTALDENAVFDFGRQMLTLLKNMRKDARFGAAKQIESGGHKIFYFDFMTQALDQSIYNAMFFFSIDGKQATGSWNCLGKDRWFWAPVFEHAVKTIDY